MLEGLLIGIPAGAVTPIVIMVLAARYVAKHPEMLMRHITRRMFSGAMKATKNASVSDS